MAKQKRPGRYGDGLGLWLQVSRTGSKSWLYRYMINGRAREMGLGPVHTISLADARDLALECRKLTLGGDDPIDARRSERSRASAAAGRALTFEQCAGNYVEAHESGWKNEKHRAQWKATLAAYAYPMLGAVAVADVDTAAVLKALNAIWKSKPETAGRLRGRIEAILDWARAHDLRHGDNPARWRGHLDKLLPAKSKIAPVKHHPALPHAQIPKFMGELRKQAGVSARALEFAILTCARTSEAIDAKWSEFDLKAKLWTVPGKRMKAGRDHRVPLSPRALAILADMPREGDFVFPGAKKNRPLSNMALLATLGRMERSDITAHGFRSSFRDWAAETTNYPREVAEMALAHTVADKVEAAYRRGDLFEKRRGLANDWALYCGSKK